MEEAKNEFADAAARTLTRLLASIGSALAAVVLFSAIVGWQTSRAYFSELGAAWITPLLSSGQRLSAAEAPIGMFVLTLPFWFFSIHQYGRGAKRLRYTYNVFLSLAFAGGLVHYGQVLRSGAYTSFAALSGLIAVDSWAVVAALAVAWAVQSGTHRDEPSASRIWTVYVLVSIGFFAMPRLWGEVRAHSDVTAQLTSLPQVEMVGLTGTWRLLTTVDGNAVIMKFPVEHKRAELRFLPITSLAAVH